MSARAGKLTLEGVRKMVAYRVNLPRFDSLFKQVKRANKIFKIEIRGKFRKKY